jgi:hypothetical protein
MITEEMIQNKIKELDEKFKDTDNMWNKCNSWMKFGIAQRILAGDIST